MAPFRLRRRDPQDEASGAGGVDETERDAHHGETGESEDSGALEWLAYELHEWALEKRVMLQQLLTADQVVHSWQGTTLHVHESLEDAVDRLVDEVEDATTPMPGLQNGDEGLTGYDIADWRPELRQQLLQRLLEAGIPYLLDEPLDADGGEAESAVADGGEAEVRVAVDQAGPLAEADESEALVGGADGGDGLAGGGDHGQRSVRDAVEDASLESVASEALPAGTEDGSAILDGAARCELLVREADEPRVELVIDDLLAEIEQADLEELEGLEANDLLGALFGACDRLRREPRDVQGAGLLAATAERLSAVRAPFGFSASNWRSLQSAVSDLLDSMADSGADPEQVREKAAAMSDSLRSLI